MQLTKRYYEFERGSHVWTLNVAGHARGLNLVPIRRRRWARRIEGLPQSSVLVVGPGRVLVIEWSDSDVRRHSIEL